MYTSTTASIPAGDVTLAGTLTLPHTEPPFPAGLLIAGSGPLDRDGNAKRLPLGISRDLAGVLADRGWASLRFDKRGVGDSTGDYLSTGLYDELSDAEAALAWLQARPDVGAIVPIGHSVGALMAAELAGNHPDLAGAVLLATTAKTGGETLEWQAANLEGQLLPAPVTFLMKLFRTSIVKQQAKAIAKLQATTSDVARIQLAKVNAKWMREFIAYDPKPALSRISIPTLAITGEKDAQVDAADLDVVARAVGGSSDTHAVPDLDHILRHEPAAVSNPRRYRKQLRQSIDGRVVGVLAEWLAALEAAPQAVNDGRGEEG